MPKLYRSRIQKAKVDGQMLELTIDLSMLPEWKREVILEMTEIMNDPSVDQDDKDMSNSTLAEVFMLFEKENK